MKSNRKRESSITDAIKKYMKSNRKYKKASGNVKFYKSGTDFANGNTYSIQMNKWRNGQQVYCVITDEEGNSVTSNTVVLSMSK